MGLNSKIVLVSRVCKCGCGNIWKTLPTSRWYYWNREHAIIDGFDFKFVWGDPSPIRKSGVIYEDNDD